MSDNIADVIIIGAGAAGLAAAGELTAQGRSVIVLEGRNRIGGRIDTLHDPAWPLPIERGAGFIRGKPRETGEILRAAGAIVYEIPQGPASHYVFQGGRLQKRPDFFQQIGEVMAVTAKVKPPGDLSFEECLRKYAARVPAQKKAWARSYVEGFDAADTREVSSRWLAAVEKASAKIEGQRLARIHGGYSRLVNFLQTGTSGAQQELSATVTRIRWGNAAGDSAAGVGARAGVEIQATRPGSAAQTFFARKALVTVPVAILRLAPGEVGHIHFDPPLPPRKRHAIAQSRTGQVVKVLLRFGEPFWEKVDTDLSFLHAPGSGGSPGAAFPTWWTSFPFRSTLLTAWAGGPAAAALSGKAPDQILTLAISTLGELLRQPRRRIQSQLIAAHVCDWQSEPLSRGAYSYAAVNGVHAARHLAEPLPPTLFFAGEATHPGLTGTVPAALASAHRAVQEILHHK